MEVLLEPVKGGWRAVAPRLRGVEAEAETQEEAIKKVKDLWSRQVAQGSRLIEVDMAVQQAENQENTSMSVLPPKRRKPSDFAGSLQGNPLWSQWREAVEAYRAEREAEL